MARSDQKYILLAEDNDDDAFLFKRALRKADLKNPVFVAFNAQTVFDYLLGYGEFADRYAYPFPSILILDFHLPDLNASEVLRWVNARPELQSLLCVILTGDLRPSILPECQAIGIDAFLQKPCNREDLVKLADAFPQHWRSAAASG
ncbi:MAG TPA: response regulator [Verrucomicrobiae bacterium]|nr:response regulator [Verrucomicrobiae bacterium]